MLSPGQTNRERERERERDSESIKIMRFIERTNRLTKIPWNSSKLNRFAFNIKSGSGNEWTSGRGSGRKSKMAQDEEVHGKQAHEAGWLVGWPAVVLVDSTLPVEFDKWLPCLARLHLQLHLLLACCWVIVNLSSPPTASPPPTFSVAAAAQNIYVNDAASEDWASVWARARLRTLRCLFLSFGTHIKFVCGFVQRNMSLPEPAGE